MRQVGSAPRLVIRGAGSYPRKKPASQKQDVSVANFVVCQTASAAKPHDKRIKGKTIGCSSPQPIDNLQVMRL